MYTILMAVHITSGSVALGAMLFPLLASKGGPLHRAGGKVFVAAIAGVILSALGLGLLLLGTPEVVRGLRLLVLAFIAGNAVWMGLRALRTKARSAASHRVADVGPPILLLAVGAFGVAFAARLGDPPLAGISAGAVVLSAIYLKYWLRPPALYMHWWYRHMSAMIFACISAAGAAASNFSALGVWPGTPAAIAVIAGVGLPGLALWVRYYRRAFSRSMERSCLSRWNNPTRCSRCPRR